LSDESKEFLFNAITNTENSTPDEPVYEILESTNGKKSARTKSGGKKSARTKSGGKKEASGKPKRTKKEAKSDGSNVDPLGSRLGTNRARTNVVLLNSDEPLSEVEIREIGEL